ncbi:PTS sugar transporter subunit IIA [Paenibacillus sp. J22TS3]|uniref:PTS sugar transporter subunit IIA n=1 Tax=Paenibacillus sp. J22TS3 TaxID=2807192 RepID=UPI001B1CF890|nr:fructose PTS transporter subunit IIA [Paenibacillus sp. J22TS3]GIP21321.1 PTS fructose transporter subunit IIA [Paenibacillus sp. J22TS3]
MNIQDLLSKDSIFLSLEPGSKEEIIRKMAAGLTDSGSVTDLEKYVQAVLAREAQSSTGIGFGVAIPHGKSAGVARASLSFARLAQPADWESLDDKPVSIVFMIAVPEENVGNEHLKILVALSRKLIHEEFREQLLKAGSADEIIELVKNI